MSNVNLTETLAYDNNGCINTVTRLWDDYEDVLITQMVHEEDVV